MPLHLRPLAAAIAATALVVAGAAPAGAAAPLAVRRTLPGSWVAPLQIAIDGPHVYVADSATSALYRVGTKTPIATGPTPSENPEDSGDLAAVDTSYGRLAYTTTEAKHADSHLIVRERGKQTLRVSLGAYERRVNPDGRTTYGATDPSAVTPACAAQLARTGQQVSYPGIVDTHPYAVTGLRDGSWLVADAGGNDVLRVDRRGRIRTVAVLPPQPVTLTPDLAKEAEVPDCAGVTVRFEAVPTDVEVGPKGIYVSTLPGGIGGAGSVYRIPWGSRTPKLLATGFESAVNLAVTPGGTIYVAELGKGLSKVVGRGAKPVLTLPGIASVEWAHGRLYASTAPAVLGAEGAGKVVVIG